MAEHPIFPNHNVLPWRSQCVGSLGSSYAKLVFNLYNDAMSDTSSWDTEEANYEFQIFEVDGDGISTGANYVRTVFDYTELVDNSSYSYAGEELITSATLNLNSNFDTYYVIRGSYEDSTPYGMGWGSGLVLSTSMEGTNSFYVSQAVNYAEFTAETETDIMTGTAIAYGTGFPAKRYSNDMGNMELSFRPSDNGEAIWVFIMIA